MLLPGLWLTLQRLNVLLQWFHVFMKRLLVLLQQLHRAIRVGRVRGWWGLGWY